MRFSGRSFLSLRSMRTIYQQWRASKPTSDADLFSPTAGRWLWNEPHQQQQHTRKFNFKALEDVVVKASGSTVGTTLKKLEKVAEGASNKVIRAFVGDRRLIVKIPDPVVPPRLVTASEVATLDFLRSEVDLPVPRVYSWSDNSDNPVGCEYIVMEEAQGRPLNVIWSELDVPKKLTVVKEVLSIQKRLLAAANIFNGYGSLYFADDAATLGISHHLPVASTGPRKYCIGPLANEHFVGPVPATSGVDCGPWRTPSDYLTSIAKSSMARVASYEDQALPIKGAFTFPVKTASNTSSTAVSDMLQTMCTAIPHLVPCSPSQNQSLLWHKDLHFGNLFASTDGEISHIVDWQDTNVLPLFLMARVPQFCQVEDDEVLLELPEDFDMMSKSKRLQIWERYRQSMLQQYYLADLRASVPDLAAVLDDKQLAPIRRQVEVSSRILPGQDVDALWLRETLLRIQQQWPDFVLEGDTTPQCPINIAGDELIDHQKDGRRYNEFQDLLKVYNIPVAEEGWVHVDEFAERQRDLMAAIGKTMESLESQAEQVEFKNRLRQWNLTDS